VREIFNFLLNIAFKGKNPSKQEIRKAVLSISDIFTTGEFLSPLNYLKDDPLLKGYILYFVPVSLAKIESIFLELLKHPIFSSLQDLKILDIGCGPSLAILPLFEILKRGQWHLEHLRYIGIEQEEKAIEVGERLIENFKPEGLSIKYEFIQSDASDFRTYLDLKAIKPDIVIFSNSLGELFDKRGIDTDTFLNFIKPFTYKNPNFTLILIEPGTRKASMRLHQMRDSLIEELELYPYSPCLNSLPCSALRANNWCYEERRWIAPSYLTFLNSLGLQVNYLKFSYVILRKDKVNIKDTFSEGEGEIIKNTSHLLNEKGKSRLWGCWKGELIDIEKLKRDFSEEEPWLKIRKGCYFSIDKYISLSAKKVRIPPDCNIKILFQP